MLLVFGPCGGRDGSKFAARKGRFQKVRRVACARRPAGADQGVGFVDEQNDRRGAGLNLVDDLFQALLEFTFYAGSGLHQANIEHEKIDVFQLWGHIARGKTLRKAFDHGGFAHAGFAGHDRVVLAAAHQDIDNLADFAVAAHDRVHIARFRLFR